MQNCNEKLNPIDYMICRIREECGDDNGRVNPWCVVEKIVSKTLNVTTKLTIPV